MFVLTYFPQVAVLAFISGPLGKLLLKSCVDPRALQTDFVPIRPYLAFIAAVPLVLAESYFITNILLRSLLLSGATDKVFDAVLVQKGYSDLVERGRSIKTSKNGGKSLGKALLKPLSSKFSTVRLTFIAKDCGRGNADPPSVSRRDCGAI